ncbi:tetratricopeptide repeat protein [Streptomyces sp. H39-C1]|uniref:tetratricopeptide repeat protein n=1 Tax=Streptomyces sp. H39-C1 TaxID=3004355 RepID=UPI0026BBEDA4
MADQVLDAGESVADADFVPSPGHGPEAKDPVPPPPSVPGCALPGDVPHFVGRRRELDGLRADIDRPGLATLGGKVADGSRVLLIAGRPGSGRTALAVHLARDVAARYADGQHFVRLTGSGGERTPPEQAARALLRALGAGSPLPEAEPGEVYAALRAALAGRRTVLVLDDVSHADQLLPLLPEGPGSLVVATSEGPLPGVPDVRPCTLGGLDTAASVDLLSQAIGPTRVTCDPRAAETLVQECAGHPTALRLVAAWLAAQPRLSVTDATSRLRAVPDEPAPPAKTAAKTGPQAGRGAVPPAEPEAAAATGSDGAPGTGTEAGSERVAGSGPKARAEVTAKPEAGPAPAAASVAHATAPEASPRATAPPQLVRAFRLVYDSLPPTAARMLRLLALAPAGLVDSHIASALAGCSVTAAQSTLDDLAAHGLLHGDPVDPPLPPQYRVPGCLEPLLRALLETRDRTGEVQLARARMLERTVRLLQSCRITLEPDGSPGRASLEGLPRSMRFASRSAAAVWLRARLPALLAAAHAAVADGELDTLARRLVANLVRALGVDPADRETAGERYQLHALVLDVATRRGLPREKAAALINLADLDVEAGRTREALDRYRLALGEARTGDDGEAEGRAMEAIGGTYLELDDPQRAADWYGRALALRLARGETGHAARLHGRLGALHTYAGRYGPALREWRAAAGAHRRLGDLPAQARALSEAARVQEYAGHPEDALRTCRDALYWARQAGDERLEGAVLLRMADTLDRLGDPGGARLQRAAAKRLLSPGEVPG